MNIVKTGNDEVFKRLESKKRKQALSDTVRSNGYGKEANLEKGGLQNGGLVREQSAFGKG